MNSETRQCENCKNSFVIEPDDFSFYEKMNVPAPMWCPDCRQRRRVSFRNFKTLYKRPSSKSGQSLVSMYSQKVPFPVWSIKEWWQDDWDARGFGRDLDLSKPFLEQFLELSKVVPHYCIHNIKSNDCEYSNAVLQSKNCYYIFGCVSSEQSAYGHIVWNSRECFDNLYVFKSELCYECIDVLNSYRLLYSRECEDCADGIGLFDCRGCTNCIGCVGLRQKTYYIFNEPVGEVAYKKFLTDHPLNDSKNIDLILERTEELKRNVPQRYFYGSHNNDVSGNHIYNAKNVHYSFDVKSGENSKFVFTARSAVDSYDISFVADTEESYENLTCAGQRSFFCHLNFNSNDAFYSEHCYGCHDIFGCEGLKSAEYCILNKQYPKEEYLLLKEKLIEHMKETGEWGEFFPIVMSPFAYNESIVNEYYPLTKEEATRLGYRWEDDVPRTSNLETIKSADLPKDPRAYSESLLKEVMKCDQCGHNYRFILSEINFYKQSGLALPIKCFNCRHERRMRERNPRMLWAGNCAKCGVAFQTSYDAEKQKRYKIYCEQCYQGEVV